MIVESKQLPSLLMRMNPEAHLISFDIFDTLLERHIEPPDAVKKLAARQAAGLFAQTEEYLAPETLLVARTKAETELRRQAQAAGFDYECALSEIAAEVAHQLAPGKEQALISAFVEGELAAEKEALFLRPGMLSLLANLRAQGKRIVAVSDMYLDGALIQRLFDDLGMKGLVDHIYVSADHKLGKYSGRLFQHVLTSENVEPSRMIHIGDNPHSDFSIPRTMGIQSIHLRDEGSLLRRQVMRTLAWLGERNPFWRGEHLHSMIPPAKGGDFHYRYGYEQLGPIFCAFVIGLLEEIRRHRIEKIYFLAREGELFRILYEKLGAALTGPLPLPGYLYVSRKSVMLPASWEGLSRQHLSAVLSNPKQKGFFSIANALGISPEEFTSVAARFGLECVDQPIRGWNEERYADLLTDLEFREVIIRHALPARRRLRRYLEGDDFFGRQRVALVDIGWNGTIQHALGKTFSSDSDFPQITGLYLSFSDNFNYGFAPEDTKGILYDGRSSPLRHNVFALFEELFENAARAHHGSTIGYRETGSGRVEPVLRDDDTPDRKAEREFEKSAIHLRRGILDHVDAYIKAVRLTGYEFDDIKPALLAKVERCVVYPTHDQATHLLQIIHAEDLGSDNVMNFNEYRFPGLHMLRHPKRLLRLLRSSNWKYGTARTLSLPGFNHVLRQIELAVARYKKSTQVTLIVKPRLSEKLLIAFVQRGGFPILNRLRRLLSR